MSASSAADSVQPSRRWYQRLGPGLITACVVIGPGSILTSSTIGARYGYSMSWVVVVAVVFMLLFMTLGARLGVISGESAGTLVANRAGRVVAALIGAAVFFISTAFQFGNNLGVGSAFDVYMPLEDPQQRRWAVIGVVAIFNAFSIGFLFAFKNLYAALERLMMMFVALMLLAFATNLIMAGPNWLELAKGFIPSLPAVSNPDATYAARLIDVVRDGTLLGLIGTTFVITAAYYQSYLVRQKGWGLPEMRDGLRDATVGSIIMALITLMIMSTAAANLRGQELGDVKDVAQGLTIFGDWGQAIFCLGLFSAAYSSFLVNSMIGGFIFCDGLGLGSRPDQLSTKLFTAAVLLTGMGVGMYVIYSGQRPVAAIVAAQAVTVVAAPVLALALLWLTNLPSIMGKHRNGSLVNTLGVIGFLLLLAMAYYLAAEKVLPAIGDWLRFPLPLIRPVGHLLPGGEGWMDA